MIKHSIIIPTAERPIAIKSAIQSLLRNNLRQNDAELIIVDNNRYEELSEGLQKYCEPLSDHLRYVREKRIGLTAARHCGADEARGSLLSFLDDDVEVSDTWLNAIQKAFDERDVSLVTGPSIPRFTCSIPAWFWDYISPTPHGGWMCGWLSLMDIGKDVCPVRPDLIWGLNFSIRKHILFSSGGFHPDLVPEQFQRWQGDGESGLASKVQAAGHLTCYAHQALVFHLCGPDRLNVEYFKKRAFYQGVCRSYSQIRAGYPPLSKKRACEWGRKILKAIRLRTSILRRWNLPVKKLTDRAERDGWIFHQSEVAKDSNLLAWVQQANYFNIDIVDLLQQ